MGTTGLIPQIIIGRTYRKIQKIWFLDEFSIDGMWHFGETMLITWEN